MFDDAEANSEGDHETMDLIEDSTIFALFLKLLHEPPALFIEEDISEQIKFETKVIMKAPKDAIPLPILTKILELAEKYMVKPSIVEPLHTHLRAHRMVCPLKVYGLAIKYGLDQIAHDTSMFLIHPLLHTYSVEEISVIPTAVALHKLLLLQQHRGIELRKILHDEYLFPHHYGECPRHARSANQLWVKKKYALLGKVNSGTLQSSQAFDLGKLHCDALIVVLTALFTCPYTGTDVAAEMTASLKDLGGCETCYKGWSAAKDMLAVSFIREFGSLYPQSSN